MVIKKYDFLKHYWAEFPPNITLSGYICEIYDTLVIPTTSTFHIPQKLCLFYVFNIFIWTFTFMWCRFERFRSCVLLLLCLFCGDILLHCVNGCQLRIIVNVKMGLLWKQGHYTHIYATVAIEVYPEGLLRIQLLKDVYRPYGLSAKRLFVCVYVLASLF